MKKVSILSTALLLPVIAALSACGDGKEVTNTSSTTMTATDGSATTTNTVTTSDK